MKTNTSIVQTKKGGCLRMKNIEYITVFKFHESVEIIPKRVRIERISFSSFPGLCGQMLSLLFTTQFMHKGYAWAKSTQMSRFRFHNMEERSASFNGFLHRSSIDNPFILSFHQARQSLKYFCSLHQVFLQQYTFSSIEYQVKVLTTSLNEDCSN